MPPSVNVIAERIYAELSPVTIEDEANGWPLLHFVHAWTKAMVSIEEIVRTEISAGKTLIRTNLISNPSFETDTTGWIPYVGPGGTVTITRVAGGYSGGFACRVERTVTPNNSGIQIQNVVPLSPGTYTWSAWVKGPVGETMQCAVDWNRDGNYELVSTQFAFTGDWQRVYHTAVIPAGVISFTNVYVWFEGALVGESFDIDAAMVTTGTPLPVYGDGDSLNWEWVGTPHASLSKQYAELSPDAPPWAGVMHPDTAPAVFLDWLSQFTGRVPRPGETEAQKRDLIASVVNIRRGSASASRAIAARYLTGEKLVSFNERVTTAWRYAIRTRDSETPDPAYVLSALMAQKPAGMILDYATLALLSYNYGDIYAVYDSYQQITDDPDYVTYADMLTAEPDIG